MATALSSSMKTSTRCSGRDPPKPFLQIQPWWKTSWEWWRLHTTRITCLYAFHKPLTSWREWMRTSKLWRAILSSHWTWSTHTTLSRAPSPTSLLMISAKVFRIRAPTKEETRRTSSLKTFSNLKKSQHSEISQRQTWFESYSNLRRLLRSSRRRLKSERKSERETRRPSTPKSKLLSCRLPETKIRRWTSSRLSNAQMRSLRSLAIHRSSRR